MLKSKNISPERQAEIAAIRVLRDMQSAQMEDYAKAALNPEHTDHDRAIFEQLYVSSWRVVLAIDTWMRTGGPNLR